MRRLLSLLLYCALVGSAAAQSVQPYSYYVIGDTNPTTQVWNVTTGAMVNNTDTGFQSWLAQSAAPLVQVTNVTNNGSNLCRLAIGSTNNGQYVLQTNQIVAVSGIGGSTQCNGVFAITVINGTTIDLQGSSAPSAYTSGGQAVGAPYFPTMVQYLLALDNYNEGLYRSDYIQTIGTNQTISGTWPFYFQITATVGSLSVTLPCANVPGAPPIGKPFVVQNNGTRNFTLKTCNSGFTTVLGPSAQAYWFILTANTTQDGTLSQITLPNFNGTPSAANQFPLTGTGTNDAFTANWAIFIQPSFFQVKITGVNFNSGNTDNAILLTMPSGYTRFRLVDVTISHASTSLTTATCGVFTATAAGGVALVTSGSAITVSASADATTNNMQVFDRTAGLAAAAGNTSFVSASLGTANTIYFRVQNAEGVSATGDVTVTYEPLP